MNPEELEPGVLDFDAGGTDVEVVNTDELNTEEPDDVGGSPPGVLQARLVRVSHPGGSEQGENRWFRGQLVRRHWGP